MTPEYYRAHRQEISAQRRERRLRLHPERFIQCGHCQIVFATRRSDRRFCSEPCVKEARAAARRANPELYRRYQRESYYRNKQPLERTVPCEVCGAVFATRKSRRLYCSLACQRKRYVDLRNRPGRLGREKDCAFCLARFTTCTPNQRFCSKNCASQHFRAHHIALIRRWSRDRSRLLQRRQLRELQAQEAKP